MNLLAKIITVLILITSLLMMFLAVTVYSTHQNWKATAASVSKERDQARNLNQQLESKHSRLQSQLQAELAAAQQEVSKLETERIQLLKLNTALQQDLDAARQQERANTAALVSTQANNEKLVAEVEALRGEITENQQSRDKAFAATLEATDQLHQAQGKLTLLNERNAQLAQELGTKTALLRENGIDPNTAPGEIIPVLRGVVSSLQQRAGVQLIEITIGADDGLKKSHTVEIYRGQRYLGRAEIIRTEPDRAVGQILRRFQQGQIQENDSVATKLRVG